MGKVKVEGRRVGPISYQLINSYPFHSLSINRSRSWVRSNFKVTEYQLVCLLFPVNSPSHFWDTVFFLQNLTLKIQGQGQGQSSRSQSGSNKLSTHSPLFHFHLFLDTYISKFDLGKIQGQGHGWGQIQGHIIGPTSYQLTSLSFPAIWSSHCWHMAISKVKVIGEVKVQGPTVTPTSFQLTPCLVHFTCHSWDMHISKFDLENQRSRSWSKFKVTQWVQYPVYSIHSIFHWIPRCLGVYFVIWTHIVTSCTCDNHLQCCSFLHTWQTDRCTDRTVQ